MKKAFKKIMASALALGIIASANVGLGTLAASAATDPNTVTVNNDPSTYKYMYNDYLKLIVASDDGRFSLGTTGGNPDSDTDDNATMIYGFHRDDSGTSYTTVVIDGSVYKYGDNGFTTAPVFNASGKRNTSVASYNDGKVTVKQTLSFVNNVSTGRYDVLEMKYTITNNDTAAHKVGTRIMIDTMLGDNDHAPFRVEGVGEVTTETEFAGDAIPQFWQAFDSLTNPKVVSQGSFLRANDGNNPDKVQFTNWYHARDNAWNYTVSEGSNNGDSAVSVIWNEKKLAAGSSRTYVTYYGLSELSTNAEGNLALSLSCDSYATCTSIDDETSLPNYSNLTVTSYIQNTSSVTVNNISTRLALPSGMSLVSGNAVTNIDSLAGGATKQLTWKVKVSGKIAPGTYPIILSATGDGIEGKSVSRKVTIKEYLKNNSTIASENVTAEEGATIKCAASGGAGSYTYAVYYKKSDSTKWLTVQDFSTTTGVVIKPEAPGDYEVCVKAKDAAGIIAKKYLQFKVAQGLENTSTLSAESIVLGKSVNVKCSANGGSTPYTYAVLYKKAADTKWTTLQNFDANATVAFKPEAEGKYNICVKVKDSAGAVDKKYFTLTVASSLTNKSTVSATKITLGNTVTVKCAASGGTAPYTYQVLCKKATDTKWVEKQKFSTNTTVSIKPSKATKYEICVKVKDSTGEIAKKYFTVNVTAPLTNNTTLTLSTTKATVNCAAKGGAGTYTYGVYVKKAGENKYTTVQDFKSTTTVSTALKSGVAYTICVKVKDADGTIAKKYFDIKVY